MILSKCCKEEVYAIKTCYDMHYMCDKCDLPCHTFLSNFDVDKSSLDSDNRALCSA